MILRFTRSQPTISGWGLMISGPRDFVAPFWGKLHRDFVNTQISQMPILLAGPDFPSSRFVMTISVAHDLLNDVILINARIRTTDRSYDFKQCQG